MHTPEIPAVIAVLEDDGKARAAIVVTLATLAGVVVEEAGTLEDSQAIVTRLTTYGGPVVVTLDGNLHTEPSRDGADAKHIFDAIMGANRARRNNRPPLPEIEIIGISGSRLGADYGLPVMASRDLGTKDPARVLAAAQEILG